MAVRVVTWNLMHGRAVPPAGHDLLSDFTAALGGWGWEVALLQEVPPWWPPELGSRLGADPRSVLTSRNLWLPVRRAIARRWPDAIKSNGGGANAILVRGAGTIGEHRTHRLRVWPERRWLHAIRLGRPGGRALWVGNLHCTVRNPAAAIEEAQLAAAVMRRWAGEAPVVLGGDFNERGLSLDGFARLAEHDVDYVFGGHGVRGSGSEFEVLDRGRLSDHAPVVVSIDL